MIRVFRPTDRDYTSNGDAVIVPIKARVKNNVNGEFTLELTAESRFYDYLTQGNIIIAPTPQGEQAFRINNQVQRKGDRITVKARHVFYDSENLVIADSYAVDLTCEQALNHFNAATDSTSPFTMHSDITDLNTFRCVRKSLGEAIGTVIERWGGYLVRNNWDISVNKSIGRDLGVTIRYAKNLNELTASYDFSGVATKILPVGKDGILLPELYVYSTVQYSTPYTKAVSISQDINEDDYDTEEEYQEAVITDLRAQAQTLVNKTCYPVITYSLKGKPEKVQDIGDVIQVIDERIGVNITTQVIGYEWDIITESYANLTFGNFGNTLSGLMTKVNSNTKGIVQESVGEVKTEVKNSIDKIYDLLQGSYVVYRGYDILLLDTIPIGAATHVIKFSKDGILISNNGVDGTFTKVYDITTQRLSVPSISLNGADLGTTLNKKLEATDILAGSNISIRRDGNKVTISAAGSKGGNKVYAGTSTPSASIGAEDDLYLQLGEYNGDILDENNVEPTTDTGYPIELTSFTKVNQRQYDFDITGIPSSYGAGELINLVMTGLSVGRTYTINFDYQYSSGTEFYTQWVSTVSIIDGNNATIASIDTCRDTLKHSYSITFTAREINKIRFFLASIDRRQTTLSITDLVITGSLINSIEEIYGKINGKWEKYEGGESYEAGDNIDITNNVISGAYQAFTGTDGTADGTQGLVPKPLTTDAGKILGANGQWIDKGAQILSGTSEPTSQDGNNGDLYVETVAAGSQYRELWTGNLSTNSWTSPQIIPNVNPSLYSSLLIYGKYQGRDITPYEINANNYDEYNDGVYFQDYYDIYWYRITDEMRISISNNRTRLTLWSGTGNTSLVNKVEGVLLGSVSYIKDIFLKENGLWTGEIGEVYSDDEQLCGIWRDGSLLYKKLVPTGGSEPSGATLVERTAMASTGYDTIKYIKTT